MPFCLISEIIHSRELICNDAKRSWILSYGGWLVSILSKGTHEIFVLLYATNTKKKFGMIKAKITQQISGQNTRGFCKKWTTTYSTTTPSKSFYTIFLISFLKSFVSEIINPWKNQWNSNFPNMKLTTYPRLTWDQAKNMIHIYELRIIGVTGAQ